MILLQPRWPCLSLTTPICLESLPGPFLLPGVLCSRFWEMTDWFKVQLKTTIEFSCNCPLCSAAYINLRDVKTCELSYSHLSGLQGSGALCQLLLTAFLTCGSYLSLPHSSPDSADSATYSEEKGSQRALTAPRRGHPGQHLLLWWRRRWRRRPGGCLKPREKA